MSYLPTDNNIKSAVEDLREMILKNPSWSFFYCSTKIAGRYRIDVKYLMGEFRKVSVPKKRGRKINAY